MVTRVLRAGILAAALALGVARADPIAIVTDVQGGATLQSGGTAAPVALLSELADGSRVTLAGGARLTALYVRSGDEYTVQGPGAVDFRAVRPEISGGATVSRRAPPQGREIRIRPASVAQGGLVVRSAGARLVSPVASTTLERSPEFRWEDARQGVRYRFSLTDADGGAVYGAETDAQVLRLPATVALKPGALYRWEVTVRSNGDHLQSVRATFRTASDDVRAQAQALRPETGAGFPSRVAYAVWLEQMELRDEARRLWRELAAERPADATLRQRAAN
jgi:hypothetical protein